jgi:hypothetical protein
MSDRNSYSPRDLVQISGLQPDQESERFFEWRDQKPHFSLETLRDHDKLKSSLLNYVRSSRFFVALTAPFIYGCIIPFVLLDLFVSIYQYFSFPIYGIPKVRRSDYVVFDRGKLRYLNALERINCAYCSYGNGVLAYVVEVAGRTEQHWCPIRHAHRIQHPHSRYAHFVPYGDAHAYRERIEAVRCDFDDVKKSS